MNYREQYDWLTALEEQVAYLMLLTPGSVKLDGVLDNVGRFNGTQYPLLRERFDNCVRQIEELYAKGRNNE